MKPEETPEEILLAQAHRDRVKQALSRRNTPIDSSGIVVGYNADYHLDEVQLWDGSIRYAEGLTNGARATSNEILYSSEGHVESTSHVKRPSVSKHPVLNALLHNLRVLAVIRNGNSYQFLAGSESQRVEKAWTQADFGEGVYLDSEYQVRIDNLNPKSKKGWVITSLWGRDSNLFLAPDSGLAISIDSSHAYNVEINHYDNMRVAGAYFFGQNWSDQLRTQTSGKTINGTRSYSESRDSAANAPGGSLREVSGGSANMFSDTNITETVEVSSNSVEDDLFGGIINRSSNAEPFNYDYMTVGFGYKSPFTLTKAGGTQLNWFTGTRRQTASYTRNFERTRVSNGSERGNLNITINSSGTFNSTQNLQTVYKSELATRNISCNSNYNNSGIATRSYDGLGGGNVIDDNIPYRQSMSQGETFTSASVQVMPHVSENTFGSLSNLNSSEQGILGSHTYYGIYFGGNSPNPVVLQLDNVPDPGLYALDITAATLIGSNVFYHPISGSANQAVNATPYLTNISYSDRSIESKHIPSIISSDGNEGIVYIEKYERLNTATAINGGRYFSSSFPFALEGQHYYKNTSDGIIKKAIQFSGSNYASSEQPYQNVNQITEAFDLVFRQENYPIPVNVDIGTQLTYDAYQSIDGTYSRLNGFHVGQLVEYEFTNGDIACQGKATILDVSGSPTTQGQISIRIDSVNKIASHLAGAIFSLRGDGITLQSLGYRVINRYTMNSYDAAAGITLKNGIIYYTTVVDDEPMYSGERYKVFVDSYKLLPYGAGDSLYLQRQPFKFINCPAIPTQLLEELETVIFAYSK